MTDETKPAGELPGIEGKGVAPVTIPKINKLCDAYVKLREDWTEAGTALAEAKGNLCEEIHKHEKEIGLDKNGEIVYRYGDYVITLKPGKEKLKVKDAPLEAGGDV